MSKVIYLKSLFNKKKPNKKAIKLIDEAICKANGFNPKAKQKNTTNSKEFILKHTKSFLEYAVDYSINDKVNEFYQK